MLLRIDLTSGTPVSLAGFVPEAMCAAELGATPVG
jgi:hypothetical protein